MRGNKGKNKYHKIQNFELGGFRQRRHICGLICNKINCNIESFRRVEKITKFVSSMYIIGLPLTIAS